MKSIKIISNLKLSHKGLECEDNCGQDREIGLLQGSMDGACAVRIEWKNSFRSGE